MVTFYPGASPDVIASSVTAPLERQFGQVPGLNQMTSTSSQGASVEDLADTRLAQKISQLPGVGLVSISGGQKPAIRVQANPTALSGYGLRVVISDLVVRRPILSAGR